MAVSHRKQVGKLLARERRKKGLTQAALGDLIGVESQTISRWERGENLGREGNLEHAVEALGFASVQEFMAQLDETPSLEDVPPDVRDQIDWIQRAVLALLYELAPDAAVRLAADADPARDESDPRSDAGPTSSETTQAADETQA